MDNFLIEEVEDNLLIEEAEPDVYIEPPVFEEEDFHNIKFKNNNEIVVCKKAFCWYTNPFGERITQDAYKSLIKEKIKNVGYIRRTVVVSYKTDKPNKLYFTVYTLEKSNGKNRNGFYCGHKKRDVKCIIFDLKHFNYVSYYFSFNKKYRKCFSTNLLCFNEADFIKTINKVYTEDSDDFLIKTLCAELKINYDDVINVQLQFNVSSVQAILFLFLLSKRGFEIESLYTGRQHNFKFDQFKDYVKFITPGCDLEGLVANITKLKKEDYNELLYNPAFESVFSKNRITIIIQVMKLFNIGPLNILLSGWENMSDYSRLIDKFKILHNSGYEYKDFCMLSYDNVETAAYIIDFFKNINIEINLKSLKNIIKYKEDFYFLMDTIKTFLTDNSCFIPKNKIFHKKLSNSEFTFSPLHYHKYVLKNTRKGIFGAPYFVHHKNDGLIGIAIFRKNESGFNIKQLKRKTDNIDVVRKHIEHKLTKTKLLEHLDFYINYFKEDLFEFIKNNVSSRYTILIKK